MSDKKISELNPITGVEIDDASDVFAISDISGDETKKVTRGEIFKRVSQATFDSVDINGGTIDGTAIGSSVASTGDFTTVEAAQVNADSVDINGGTITGITDLAVTDGGTGASTPSAARNNLGLGSMSTQDIASVDINGGTIDGTAIGSSVASTGDFTALSASGDFSISGGAFFVDESTGYVGIGTTVPATALNIVGSNASSSLITIERSGRKGQVGVTGNNLLLDGDGSDGTNGGVVVHTGGTETVYISPDKEILTRGDKIASFGGHLTVGNDIGELIEFDQTSNTTTVRATNQDRVVTNSDGTEFWVGAGTKLSDFKSGEVQARDNANGTMEKLLVTPYAYGADPSAAVAANDTAFSEMVSQLNKRTVDLCGLGWPVSSVPNLPGAVNGYWIVGNFDESLPAWLPARNTLDRRSVLIEGGEISLGWPQGTMASYNGILRVGYMAANGHNPGEFNWSLVTLSEKASNAVRFEPGQDFGNYQWETEVFAHTVVPPSTSGGTYDGAYEYAIATGGAGIMSLFTRALAEYQQDGGGGLDQSESDWSQVLVDGASFGAALRQVVDSAYSVSTQGLPTLVQGLSLYGGGDPGGNAGNFFFTYHGLGLSGGGSFPGPFAGYVSGSPKDGTGGIVWVGRIGNLTEGVEPSVAWFKQGGASRLCGFIRSQSASYPIRFWVAGGLNQASLENADIQDCPWGNDFATYSPVNCAMRPLRKGVNAGWIPTWETLDGAAGEELHFTFTGRRTRDGSAGDVWLYWGYVPKGSTEFDNMWDRAVIVPIKKLWFADSNDTKTSNQVGTPDITFVDSNTVSISFTNERPAIAGDEDESYLEVMTIFLKDNYGDSPVSWDNGDYIPTDVVKAPEYRGYKGETFNLGSRSDTQAINSGHARFAATNLVLAPESGTEDDLTEITGGIDGSIVSLRVNSSSNTINVLETGNIVLSAAFSLTNARDRLLLIYDSGAGEWVELTRSDNA